MAGTPTIWTEEHGTTWPLAEVQARVFALGRELTVGIHQFQDLQEKGVPDRIVYRGDEVFARPPTRLGCEICLRPAGALYRRCADVRSAGQPGPEQINRIRRPRLDFLEIVSCTALHSARDVVVRGVMDLIVTAPLVKTSASCVDSTCHPELSAMSTVSSRAPVPS